MNYYVFFITVPNLEEGKKIARYLVENKLAACVNIVPEILSIYSWKGNVEEDKEYLLVVKTDEVNAEKITSKIKELHSYEVPECIGIKIEKGSRDYLDWIGDSLLIK